jgi:hypothetical protein
MLVAIGKMIVTAEIFDHFFSVPSTSNLRFKLFSDERSLKKHVVVVVVFGDQQCW